MAAIENAEGSVVYDGPRLKIGGRTLKPKLPEWLIDSLGVDYFAVAIAASVEKPEPYSYPSLSIGQLHHLEALNVSGDFIDDFGLVHLRGLGELRCLMLKSRRVTTGGWQISGT